MNQNRKSFEIDTLMQFLSFGKCILNKMCIWRETEIGGYCIKKINKISDFRNAITTYTNMYQQTRAR